MPDPTPEERAEALRLAEDWADRWTGHHPTGLAAEPLAMARALLAAESERAELAREVEELRGRLRRAEMALYPDQTSTPRPDIDPETGYGRTEAI